MGRFSLLFQRADDADALRVVGVGAVAEVEAEHVGAGAVQALDHLRRGGGGAERGDDLGPPPAAERDAWGHGRLGSRSAPGQRGRQRRHPFGDRAPGGKTPARAGRSMSLSQRSTAWRDRLRSAHAPGDRRSASRVASGSRGAGKPCRLPRGFLPWWPATRISRQRAAPLPASAAGGAVLAGRTVRRLLGGRRGWCAAGRADSETIALLRWRRTAAVRPRRVSVRVRMREGSRRRAARRRCSLPSYRWRLGLHGRSVSAGASSGSGVAATPIAVPFSPGSVSSGGAVSGVSESAGVGAAPWTAASTGGALGQVLDGGCTIAEVGASAGRAGRVSGFRDGRKLRRDQGLGHVARGMVVLDRRGRQGQVGIGARRRGRPRHEGGGTDRRASGGRGPGGTGTASRTAAATPPRAASAAVRQRSARWR